MITWRKLMGSGQMILPNMFFLAAVRWCAPCAPSPVCNSLTPNIGNQGTDVRVTLAGDHLGGCHFSPPVIGIQGSDVSLVFDPSVDPWNDVSVTFTLHIPPNASPCYHEIDVLTDRGGMSGVNSIPFLVSYPGCPPPSQLLNVFIYSGGPLVPGGPPVTFQFEGTNFANNNPQVQVSFGGPGLAFSTPYNLQSSGGLDSFLVDVTANACCIYDVTVTTNGCSFGHQAIVVDASQPPPSPTPGAPPFLSKIFSGDVQNPAHITKYASTTQGGTVSLKFEGTGFGTNSEIIVDFNNFIQQIVEVTGATTPDTVRTGRIYFYLPAGTDPAVTLHVHNLDNDTLSNGVLLILDEPDPAAPVVNTAYFLINGFAVTEMPQNSDADLYIYGQNLEGVTEQSFSGVAGLTFSHVSYPIEGAVRVQVHADANAPLSADEVTNLTVTNFDGTRTRRSNPFWIGIVPAPPP